jgi:leader peptidase (prepilin peptidase)/N-methyltransferase
LERFTDLVGLFAFGFALCIGSFLNVCIARIPEDRSVVWPPSACPACGHRIRARDNVPVLSWLLLRGRCRDCATPISPLYPAIELLTGLMGWLVYRRVVTGPGDLDLAHLAAWVFFLLFAAMLIAQTYIDIRHYIVPDEFSIYAVPFGVGGAALLHALGYTGAPTWQGAVVGALAGGGTLGLVSLAYWLVRREEGVGLGDVKLLAMIGSFLGALPALPVVVMVGSMAGAAVGLTALALQRKGLRSALPFGPFLALGALVYLLHGDAILRALFPGLRGLL